MALTKATTNVVNLDKDTLINEITAGRGGGNNNSNTVFGRLALASNTTGLNNTAVGVGALQDNTTGVGNTSCGADALANNTTGADNTAIGVNALRQNTTGIDNTAVGVNALANSLGDRNTAVGLNTLSQNTTGSNNTAIGLAALQANTTGVFNTALGYAALLSNTFANSNTAVGSSALQSTIGAENTAVGGNSLAANTTGYRNSALGLQALRHTTTGYDNTAVGHSASVQNITGHSNTACGISALNNNTTANLNTAIGAECLSAAVNFDNCSGIGYAAQVDGPNQVQLGNSATTTYVYGAVQARSDIRDKADIRDTELGLEFVNALRPVDFKWDMREDYRPEAPKPVAKPIEPKEPQKTSADASDGEKYKYEVDKAKYDQDKAKYDEELPAYEAYVVLNNKWLEDVKLANITHDGSKKRSRFHHGLIAQEVKAVLDAKGIDFGGFQDHSIKGGDDVLSIGYEELIAPMLKAIQELSAEVAALKAK